MNNAKRPLRSLLALLLAALITAPAAAASPDLNNLVPVAGQRGTDVPVTFFGNRLNDATGVLFQTPGLSVSGVVFEDNRVRATLHIPADAPLGEHQLRLVTKSGVTEMMTFHVVDHPIVGEEEDKYGSFDNPQPVELNTTVLGRTRSEDIDYFAVDMTKGQRLTVQVDGMRLGRGFTDSYLAVLDQKRFEIAVSDDTALLGQDPYVSLLAPEDGRYIIALRDSAYEGGDNNRYMLHVGTFTRPAAVYPAGGRPGERVTLRFVDDPAGDFEQALALPDRANPDHIVMPERDGLAAPSGHAFRVNALANVLEGDSGANNNMEQVKDAEPGEVPVAFNGIIDTPGDEDFFKLRLRKGQPVTVRCYANAIGSPLDSVVNVWRADNRQHLQGNDDQGGPDSIVSFDAPEDGEYFVRVRDHLGRGGPDYVYRLEATVPVPSLRTYIDRYDRNRPQERQAIAVPQGNRYAALVRVERERVGGPLDAAIQGLPEGVSFAGYGPDGRGEMPVVFEADPAAPLGYRIVDIGALSQPRGDSAERVHGPFEQRTPLVLANPNRTEYYHSTLRTMPVAVTETVPFRIDVEQPAVPLVRNGKMRLKVSIHRDGYEGRMRLYMLWRPPGVGATGRIDIGDNQTEAVYEIDANGNAPTTTWPMVIIGHGDTGLGPAWVSSQLFEVTVQEPFVTGGIAKAKCDQGEPVDVVVNLQHPREWAGEGELKLYGLPAECSVQPLTITPGQEEATFRVTTTANTPAGQHKGLLCELTIQVDGQPVIHRFGHGGQLRIDRPRPPRDEAPASRGGGE